MAGSHMQDGKRDNSKPPPKVHVKLACPLLRIKDVCKRDMKSAVIDIASWELKVEGCSTCKRGNQTCRECTKHATVEKRNIRKAMGTVALPNTIFKYERCCSINPGSNPQSHETDRGQ